MSFPMSKLVSQTKCVSKKSAYSWAGENLRFPMYNTHVGNLYKLLVPFFFSLFPTSKQLQKHED